jgi:hypothetical protein
MIFIHFTAETDAKVESGAPCIAQAALFRALCSPSRFVFFASFHPSRHKLPEISRSYVVRSLLNDTIEPPIMTYSKPWRPRRVLPEPEVLNQHVWLGQSSLLMS